MVAEAEGLVKGFNFKAKLSLIRARKFTEECFIMKLKVKLQTKCLSRNSSRFFALLVFDT